MLMGFWIQDQAKIQFCLNHFLATISLSATRILKLIQG